MKRISLWAFHHKWSARLIIVFSYLLLNVIGFFFGNIALENNIIPFWVSYFLAFSFLLAFIFYPSRKQKAAYKNFYVFQKTLDGILIITTFLLIVIFSNRVFSPSDFSSFPKASATTVFNIASTTNTNTVIEPKKQKSNVIRQWKQLKENIKVLRKAYKNAKKGGNTGLLVLATLVALLLFVLVLSLSCNLSCSGSEGAALVVALLGTALIVFGLIKVIQRINRGPKKEAPKPSAL